MFRERPLIRNIVGVLMSTGGKGRRGDAFVLRLIFIQNERTSYWVARSERARWFLGRSSQNAAWECCIIGFTQVDGGSLVTEWLGLVTTW